LHPARTAISHNVFSSGFFDYRDRPVADLYGRELVFFFKAVTAGKSAAGVIKISHSKPGIVAISFWAG